MTGNLNIGKCIYGNPDEDTDKYLESDLDLGTVYFTGVNRKI